MFEIDSSDIDHTFTPSSQFPLPRLQLCTPISMCNIPTTSPNYNSCARHHVIKYYKLNDLSKSECSSWQITDKAYSWKGLERPIKEPYLQLFDYNQPAFCILLVQTTIFNLNVSLHIPFLFPFRPRFFCVFIYPPTIIELKWLMLLLL